MYEIYITKNAERGIKKLSREIVERIIPKIQNLIEHPQPHGCRKISGTKQHYRIRIGDYRVVYEIDDEKLRITIIAVGHRKDVYNY